MDQPEDVLVALARRVTELREASGMTGRALASAAGIPQATWSRREGKGDFSVSELLRLQSLLGVETLESFFGELPSHNAADREMRTPS